MQWVDTTSEGQTCFFNLITETRRSKARVDLDLTEIEWLEEHQHQAYVVKDFLATKTILEKKGELT